MAERAPIIQQASISFCGNVVSDWKLEMVNKMQSKYWPD